MVQIASSFAEADTAPRANKRKLFSRGIAGAIVAAIIICECAAAYILLSGIYPTGKAPPRKVAAAVQAHAGDVDLGKFSLTALDPNSSGSLLIEFHLLGSVVATRSAIAANGGADHDGSDGNGSDPGNATEDGKTAFERLFQPEKSRFRDQVIVIISRAQISLLSYPDLEELDQQIAAQTNSLLGEPLLKEIRFSDFAVVEQ